MEEACPLEEKLSNVAADLLSERRFEAFVRRLFAAPPGVWQGVAACCSSMPVLPGLAAEVFAGHAECFVVTHLPWPGLPSRDPYALVLFLHADIMWSTTALYNRAVFGADSS